MYKPFFGKTKDKTNIVKLTQYGRICLTMELKKAQIIVRKRIRNLESLIC